MSNELEQLLREADAGAGPPVECRGNLSDRVRQVAHRRRKRRVAGSALAAVSMVAICGLYTFRPPSPSPHVHHDVQPAPAAAEIEAAIASLEAEADARMAIVEQLVVAERRRRDSVRRPHAQDPLVAVRREQDKAAYLLIYEADRLAQVMNERARAEQEYRRVVALFPESHWASVARERLVELNGASKGPERSPIPNRITIEEFS